MIYTVCVKADCERDMAAKEAEGKRLMKRGDRGGGRQRGGAVWETPPGAQAFVDKYPNDGLAVYGVEADWDKHTFQYDGEDFRRLLVDKPLVKLEEGSKHE